MKKQILLLGVSVIVLLTGCVVTSVYPYYTNKDLVFEPALLGDWVEMSKANNEGGLLRVEKLGEQGYLITAYGDGNTNSAVAHLFRLKRQLFLDTCATNRSLDLIPVHQIEKVLQLQPELVTASLKYKWLEELLKKKPGAIRHMMLRGEGPHDEDDERIVLTADTAELQRFILKHLNNTNAWDEPKHSRKLN
jgi:hypothetical protein